MYSTMKHIPESHSKDLRSKDAGNNEILLSEQCLKFAIGHQNGLVVLQTKSKNENAVQKGREILLPAPGQSSL
jgi:hypothetical protein